jgi:GNAT superfamily N-acetyltransferase
MPAELLNDRARIETFLRQDTFLHLYALGDLDDFYWRDTAWFGWLEGGVLQAIILLYTAFDPPILLATANPAHLPATRRLFAEIQPHLPTVLYTHAAPELLDDFRPHYRIAHHGEHLKMALRDPSALRQVQPGSAARLTPADLPEIRQLYAEGYADNAFDPRMLETGQFFGIREAGILRSLAGIHVYSPRYRVAAIGNVVTHPHHRGRGLGTRAAAAVCLSVLPHADHIGLNVKSDNVPALRSYRRLGFEPHCAYLELTLTADRENPAPGGA